MNEGKDRLCQSSNSWSKFMLIVLANIFCRTKIMTFDFHCYFAKCEPIHGILSTAYSQIEHRLFITSSAIDAVLLGLCEN